MPFETLSFSALVFGFWFLVFGFWFLVFGFDLVTTERFGVLRNLHSFLLRFFQNLFDCLYFPPYIIFKLFFLHPTSLLVIHVGEEYRPRWIGTDGNHLLLIFSAFVLFGRGICVM